LKILVTGAAGFIGFHLCQSLLKEGHDVVGLDNINGYYDVKLKFARLAKLGISQIDATPFNIRCESTIYGSKFKFVRMHLEDREKLPKLFRKENFERVCNLAAQAGVRFSIENPEPYIDSNVVGFLNLLECCRNFNIEHLVYASSSSVYGLSDQIPFTTDQKTEQPISLYAATKKSNELMAHTYSHLFKLPTTGLRFFTVYGPWGRPDMAYFLFADAIRRNKPIKVFNNGKMERDFTYVGDIVQGVQLVLESSIASREQTKDFYRIYNIGKNKSEKLIDFIEILEEHMGRSAQKEFLPVQPGDVIQTWADASVLSKDYGYHPDTPIQVGLKHFIEWYNDFYAEPKVSS
jgi:UDP-glucuronate 4-epimerase